MWSTRAALWAGLVGSLLFVATFSIEGLLRPGYDARSMFISELALGPRGWVQTLNFWILGPCLMLLALRLPALLGGRRASRAGPVLFGLIGFGLVMAGVFVVDSRETFPPTLVGQLHGIAGALVLSLSPVTCFVFARRYWPGGFGVWTLLAGLVSGAAVVGLRFLPMVAPDFANHWVGVIQRLIVIPFLVWVATLCWRGLKRDSI
jgi:hypothetical membrane protein